MDKEYETRDIVLAATLRVLNFVMKDIVVDGTKGTFIFEDVPSQVIDDYDLQRIKVEPMSLNNMIKQLTTSVRRMSGNA